MTKLIHFFSAEDAILFLDEEEKQAKKENLEMFKYSLLKMSRDEQYRALTTSVATFVSCHVKPEQQEKFLMNFMQFVKKIIK